MVLGFCTWNLWQQEDNNHENDLKMQALELLVTDAHETKYEKEFRVFFDGTKPTGLGFRSQQQTTAKSLSKRSLLHTIEYDCIVNEVVDGGFAHEYNRKCRSLGDYSRMIVEGLRIRKVNHEDLEGVGFDLVIQKMQAAKPAFFLTFVDVNSKPTTAATRRSTQMVSGNVVRQRQSTIGTGAGLSLRHNSLVLSDPGSKKRLSLAQVAQEMRQSRRRSGLLGTNAAEDPTNATLLGDLTKKNLDYANQIEALKHQMDDLHHEKDRMQQETTRIAQERDEIALVNEQLTQQKAKLENDLATERTKQTIANAPTDAKTTELMNVQKELEATEAELATVKQQHEQLVQWHQNLQQKLDHQVQLVEAKQVMADQLQHERDAMELRLKELQHEHEDTKAHEAELHERLVAAQTNHRAAEDQLRQLQQEKTSELQRLSELKMAIEATTSQGTELDRLMHQERRRSAALLPSSPSHVLKEHMALLQRLKDERDAISKHRDELLMEVSCHEQQLETVQSEMTTLESTNVEMQRTVKLLQEQERQSHEREQTLRLEMEKQRQQLVQESESTQLLLNQTIRDLQQQLAKEKSEKERLMAALSSLEDKARARVEAHTKELEFLQTFKQTLVKGVTVIKYGRTGQPHARILYCDPQCRWIAWRKTSEKTSNRRFETKDIADVLVGAQTQIFQRYKPQSAKCLSLVLANPCRTLDMEAETIERHQFLLKGFQLLHQQVQERRT